MIAETVAGAVLGAAGFVPFFHVNLLLQIFQHAFEGNGLAVFAVSLTISHAFFELVPLLLLCSPLAGRIGDENGLRNICVAGIFSLLLSIAALPLFSMLLPLLLTQLQAQFKFFFLTLVAAYLLSEGDLRKKIAGVAVFLLAGALGSITFATNLVVEPLFPLLSGFFALPALLLRNDAPESEARAVDYGIVPISVLASGLSTLFPALTVGVLVGMMALAVNEKRLAIAIPAVMISKSFYDIAAAFITGKTRSFAAVISTSLASLGNGEALLLISAISLASAGMALFILFAVLGKALEKYKEIESPNARSLIIFGISALILLAGGLVALAIAYAAAAIGLLAASLRVRRSNLVGALILPSLLYSFGLDFYLKKML